MSESGEDHVSKIPKLRLNWKLQFEFRPFSTSTLAQAQDTRRLVSCACKGVSHEAIMNGDDEVTVEGVKFGGIKKWLCCSRRVGSCQ